MHGEHRVVAYRANEIRLWMRVVHPAPALTSTSEFRAGSAGPLRPLLAPPPCGRFEGAFRSFTTLRGLGLCSLVFLGAGGVREPMAAALPVAACLPLPGTGGLRHHNGLASSSSSHRSTSCRRAPIISSALSFFMRLATVFELSVRMITSGAARSRRSCSALQCGSFLPLTIRVDVHLSRRYYAPPACGALTCANPVTKIDSVIAVCRTRQPFAAG